MKPINISQRLQNQQELLKLSNKTQAYYLSFYGYSLLIALEIIISLQPTKFSFITKSTKLSNKYVGIV